MHFPILNEPNELRSNTFDSRKPGRLLKLRKKKIEQNLLHIQTAVENNEVTEGFQQVGPPSSSN